MNCPSPILSYLGLLLLAGWLPSFAAADSAPSSPSGPLAGARQDFGPILLRQLARCPAMQLQDGYKLLFQACLGSEHAVGTPAAVVQWLEREIAGLGAGPDEPLLEPISPSGDLVRVHLRPFVQQQGDVGKLAAAFVQTANSHRGSRDDLAAAWQQVVALAARGELPWPTQAVQDYGREMAAAGYPPVHHSAAYVQQCHPAYRVVAREHLAWLAQ